MADLLEKYGTPASGVTATADGLTTGLILTPSTSGPIVTVTSDSASKKISLPAGTLGDRITLAIGATGCELIAVTAADKVNNVTVGATNQLALLASTVYVCTYVSTNNWVVLGNGITTRGAPKLALTAALTAVTHQAPGTPDYAMANPVQNTGFGFSTADEMNTALSVIANLQARVLELEGGVVNAITPDAIA